MKKAALGKKALLLPPQKPPQQKELPAKRPRSANSSSHSDQQSFKKNGPSQMANESIFSQSSMQESRFGKSNFNKNKSQSKLNSSFEEKKEKLKRINKLLKGEQETLQEELGDSSEEEFEFLQKESAMKEFQKQVQKQEERVSKAVEISKTGVEGNQQQLEQTTVKKDALPTYLADVANLQDTIVNQQTQQVEPERKTIGKNAAPVRVVNGLADVLQNNFMTKEELEAPLPVELPSGMEPSNVEPVVRKEPNRRRIHTLKERIKCCIKIQSTIRMCLERKKYLKEKKRVELLFREHQMNKDLDDYEEAVGQELYAMGKGGFQVDAKPRYKISFPGLNIPGSENLQTNVFYPVLLQTLATHGHLELMNDPLKIAEANAARKDRANLQENPDENEEDGDDLLDEDQKAAKTYKLFNQRREKIKRKRHAPMKIPLNNYFDNQKSDSLIENFIRRNRNNIPLSLKKSTSFDGQPIFRLPEQYSLKRKQMFHINSQTQDETKQNKQTVEKAQKDINHNNKRRHSVGESEEDYMKESFDVEISKDSLNESIKESFHKESSRFQNSSIISESIKINNQYGHDIHEESAIGESIQQDNSIMEDSMIAGGKKKKVHRDNSIQEEIIHTSLDDDGYGDEKFESISEDLNDKSIKGESIISEDLAGISQDSHLRSSLVNQNQYQKKKSVRFGEKQGDQQMQPSVIQNNSSGILRKSQESEKGVGNFSQFQHQSSKSEQSPQQQSTHLSAYTGQAKTQQNDKDWLGKETVSDAWKKYENLKIQYENEAHMREMTHEQMEVGKVQREIHRMLENTKKLTDKWQQEREELANSDRNVSQQADYLYSRFQCEFNRLLNNTSMGGKFSVLSNYFDYRDKRIAVAQANKTTFQQSEQVQQSQQKGGAFPTRIEGAVEKMVQNIEAKQDIMQGVLMQVIDNLTNLRHATLDFNEIKRAREDNDSKLDRLLANQEKILRMQYEKQIEQKDAEIKNLLKAFADGQKTQANAVLSDEDIRKLRLKALLAQNRPDSQLQQFQLIQNQHQQFVTVPQQVTKQPQQTLFEINSDSSVDQQALSDSQVSWQSGNSVWEKLTEKDREKMNDFNTEEVVNFLSDLLMQEIQQDIFPVRMTTSHLSTKKIDERTIQDRGFDKISPARGSANIKSQQSPRNGMAGAGAESPFSRRGQKSDRTLTEDSKYESDFEDSMVAGNMSNNNNNISKSYQQEETDNSKSKIIVDRQTISNADNKNLKESKTDLSDDLAEYQLDDFEDTIEHNEEESKEKESNLSLHQEIEEEVSNDQPDPMGINKVFDRNSLLAEIEENEKGVDKKANALPKLNGATKPKSPKAARAKNDEDEDYKGDNDFFVEKVENEEGQIEKDLNKDLFKNVESYEKANRMLKYLSQTLKNKKKIPIIKQITRIISQNNQQDKGLDGFLGNVMKTQLHLFDQHELKNDEEKLIAEAFQEQFVNNVIQNIHDLEQFHYSHAFNRKEIEAELALRWEHLNDVAAQQTLRILEKVVPAEYYSDVKIDKYTPFKKVKRFCKINKVAKEDNDLFEIQSYELFKQQVHTENNIADNILAILSAQLAQDLIAIQTKQLAK